MGDNSQNSDLWSNNGSNIVPDPQLDKSRSGTILIAGVSGKTSNEIPLQKSGAGLTLADEVCGLNLREQYALEQLKELAIEGETAMFQSPVQIKPSQGIE